MLLQVQKIKKLLLQTAEIKILRLLLKKFTKIQKNKSIQIKPNDVAVFLKLVTVHPRDILARKTKDVKMICETGASPSV